MVRVTNYFDTQIRIPLSDDERPTQNGVNAGIGPDGSWPAFRAHRMADSVVDQTMSDEQIISWYGKILDGVKQRYRKLQRLGR